MKGEWKPVIAVLIVLLARTAALKMEARDASLGVLAVVGALPAVEPAVVEVVEPALQTSTAGLEKNVVTHWDWVKGPARPLVLVVEGFPEAEGTVRTTVIAPMVRSVVS